MQSSKSSRARQIWPTPCWASWQSPARRLLSAKISFHPPPDLLRCIFSMTDTDSYHLITTLSTTTLAGSSCVRTAEQIKTLIEQGLISKSCLRIITISDGQYL